MNRSHYIFAMFCAVLVLLVGACLLRLEHGYRLAEPIPDDITVHMSHIPF